MNLIDPSKLNDEELNYYTTELKSVIKYVKSLKNLEELQRMLSEDESFNSVDSDTAKMINALSGREIITEPEGGKNNMNNAIEELWTTAHAEGEAEGEAKGEEKAREEERANVMNTAKKFFEKGFRLDQAIEMICYDENAIRGWWSEFENAPKLSV